MSKQFRLFLTPSDAEALVQELRDRFGARLLSEKSATSDPVELESPVQQETAFERTGATSIHCYLAPSNGRVTTNYFPALRGWLIESSSEVIEVSGYRFDGKTLLVGRFYFQNDRLVGGEIVKKRTEFLQWADGVFRYTKKALKRDRELGAYIGKDALKFRENGGKFAWSLADAGVQTIPPVDSHPAGWPAFRSHKMQ